MVSVDLVSALMEKSIQLKNTLEERKYAHKGISNEPYFQDVKDAVISGDIDPKKYWKIVEFEMLEEKMNLRNEMRFHRRASLAQVAYFEKLFYEYNGLQEEAGTGAYSKRRKIELPIEMGEALGWGFYHWAFAEDFFGRISRVEFERAKMGGEAKSSKSNEEKVFLKYLVKTQLEHHPQREKGWSDLYDTSEVLAKKIEEIVDEQKFSISKKGIELQDEIFILLDESKDVASVYEKFSRAGSR